MNRKRALYCLLALLLLSLLSGCKPADTPASTPTTSLVGWKKFEGGGVKLYLPDGWEGAGGEMLDVLIAECKEIPDRTQIAAFLEASRDSFNFWAFDARSLAAMRGVTNVCIGKNITPMPLDQYLDVVTEQSVRLFESAGGNFSVVEREVGPLGNYREVGYLVIDQALQVEMKAVQYIVKQGTSFWTVCFTTPADEFEEYRPIFSKAFETFEIDEIDETE